MSIRRTSFEPSAIEGLVLIRVVMPKRCAMSATARVPTSWDKPHRHGVDRKSEGVAHPDRPDVTAVVVARGPAVHRDRRVLDDRIGMIAGLERRHVDEQFERRARLAIGLGRAIVDRILIVAPADHRAHRAVAIEADQGALRAARGIGVDRRFARPAACQGRSWSTRRSAGWSRRSACRAGAAPNR